jgi:starch-binding outer membrane protein, SusD/RagB family
MKKFVLYSFITILVTSISCNKSELDIKNEAAYPFEAYFASDAAIDKSVAATYSTLLHQGLWAREYYFIFDLMGGDAKPNTPLLGDLLAMAQYNFGSNQEQITLLWASLYRMILRANVVIDRTTVWTAITTLEQQHKKQYIAEAKFLRAYANFLLVNCYGAVPLRKDYVSTVADKYPSRNTVAEVWKAVEDDLKDAQVDLPISYDAQNLGRATKGAATALLGKSYLYQKKWQAAQDELTKLTLPPYNYTLESNYLNIFNENNQNSTENIFQVMHKKWSSWGEGNQYYVFGGQEGWGGKHTHSGIAQEYGFKDWTNVKLSDAAVKAFTYPNPAGTGTYVDPRAKFTFYGDAASGGQTQYCQTCPGGVIPYSFVNAAEPQRGGYSPLKYQYYDKVAIYGGPQSGINSQVIRYADVLLMLAETYIQQGNTGAVPLGLINQVRTRAGATSYTSLGAQADATTILIRERQLELCGEQSRYFDLQRWGIFKQTLNAQFQAEFGKQPVEDKHLLFPIPAREKNVNPNIVVQNGWN